MKLDTETGFDIGDTVAAGSEGHELYRQYMRRVEAEASRLLPEGTLFSVGNLSDGTGHGHVCLDVQGEYVDQYRDVLKPLEERFPSVRIVPLSAGYYEHLSEHRDEYETAVQQQQQIALVWQEMKRVCEPDGILFDIRIVGIQSQAGVMVIVFVQGECRDRVQNWLADAFGGDRDQRIDVRPLSLEHYQDLRRRKGGKQFAAQAQSM